TSIALRMFEIAGPTALLLGKCSDAGGWQGESGRRRIVAIGAQMQRHLAVNGGAVGGRQRIVALAEAGLSAFVRDDERPGVEMGCAEIRPEIAAMPPDRAVVHEAIFE